MALSLQREMNRLFDDFTFPDFGDRLFNRWTPTTGFWNQRVDVAPVIWTPRVDVDEDEQQVRVQAELPGVPKENVKIDVENNMLTISGENDEVKDINDRGVRVRERRYGRFERRVGLPSTVDHSKVQARMENGVLQIALPKSAEAQPKRITVQ